MFHISKSAARSLTLAALLTILLAVPACVIRRPRAPRVTWDDPTQWQVLKNKETTCELRSEAGPSGGVLRLDYTLGGSHGYVELTKAVAKPAPEDVPVAFSIRCEGTGDLELKFVDADGSVFGRKDPLAGQYKDWTPLVVYWGNTEYWWGGDDEYSGLARFQWVVSGKGRGTVWIDDIGLGAPGLKASFPAGGSVLDPDRELAGIGFRQRRAAAPTPEDPLVLEWLKQVQDVSSPARKVLPSMENNELQTFNNALAAMAFIVKGERERAERILDFFAAATVRTNEDPTLQNFFYRGEPRGFFQAVNLNDDATAKALHTFKPTDRWMGDMAWLLVAYKCYEKEFGTHRYEEITHLLKDLLVSWYTDASDGPGGYVQHGWIKGDSKLHAGFGHAEGNIDCYAVFKLCGEERLAEKIKTWLDRVIKGKALPLDNYTWRALAFGKDYAKVLNTPDYDLRYRKTLTVNGNPVAGLYDHADLNITNSWLDGVGHIACAYLSVGEMERGWFYGNQLDPFLIDRNINGVRTRSLPYTANAEGGYGWVLLDRGFLSVAAWYILAKNEFNPMTLEKHR
ncbi:MAG: hypothetical protein V1873_01375 [Verrucomicrobiota bacterium]